MLSTIDSPTHIYIAASTIDGAGRGVFAKNHIPAGTIIEQCPVIALHDPKARARLRKTELVNYYFLWGKNPSRPALCLGWGSIYNHSFTPNAQYTKHIEKERMDFYALRDISIGEEITVNYNGDPHNRTSLRIPGIPVDAGGPAPVKVPRVVDAVLRRLYILKNQFTKKSR